MAAVRERPGGWSEGRPRQSWLIVASVVAVVLHLAGLYLPSAPDAGLDLPGSDKVAHVLLFALPVWLLGTLTRRTWLVAGLFAAHAVVSELIQHFLLPHRSGDPLDLLADLAGIALASWLLVWQRRRADPDQPGDRAQQAE